MVAAFHTAQLIRKRIWRHEIIVSCQHLREYVYQNLQNILLVTPIKGLKDLS